MRWGRQRRQQQQQQQQEQEQSTSAFSLFRVLPLSSWFSKLKHTRSKPEPPPPPATAPVSKHRPQIPPPSKPRTQPPEFRPRAPPPRFSPERPHLRPSSASDHLSFSPAVLDRLVGRAHEGTSPRRHSCGGDDAAAFFVRSRSRGERPFESARFHMAWTEPGFPLLSCRSCRADPERQHGFFRDADVSSETEREESEDDDSGRQRRRWGHEAAPRRKPVRGRRATGEGPSPPKDSATSLKPSHGVPTGEFDWRSSGRTERSCRRQPSAPEPMAAQVQRPSGARRSFSFGGKMRQRSRVKVYSPRAAAAAARAARERNECTSRKKVAVAAAASEEEEERRRRRGRGKKRRSLESFAVVKCSTDPQEDFRESMVEMIRQNGIGRPEEMEGLLACYLALNADEYHDVIVKVFRQVWLDLRTARSEFS
ncbi:hypothetical protein Taro_013457 [Colocasia esculenta]|uniref:Transcription repressor n=1 Tax=Colocasia esculenta TaxID=4460 RepID=A0A843UGI5_COLES|nr:hypothetical protein [Colocasia esculenta]